MALRARFEDLNATVRWTVAGDGLTEPNLNIFFPKERKYVTNLAGTCLDDGYLKCTLITKQKDIRKDVLFVLEKQERQI